jgi:hypothetical protein
VIRRPKAQRLPLRNCAHLKSEKGWLVNPIHNQKMVGTTLDVQHERAAHGTRGLAGRALYESFCGAGVSKTKPRRAANAHFDRDGGSLSGTKVAGGRFYVQPWRDLFASADAAVFAGLNG